METLAKVRIDVEPGTTVLVGANNSGKSRLMRALAATPKLNVLPSFPAFEPLFQP